MTYSLENTNDLIALANAIRAKTSDTANYSVADMATAVASISTGSSSGNGYVVNKQFYETSNVYEVAGTVQQGSYLDVDTELARDKEFIFVFTLHSTYDSSSIAKNSSAGFERNDYIFFYDGSNFSCLNVPAITSSTYPKINFELIYDNETQTNVVRFNNNYDYTTTENGDINLGRCGYQVSVDSKSRYIWGQLFYLNNFDEVGDINISYLEGFNLQSKMQDIIDILWDKLTFNNVNSSASDAFSYYYGQKKDWRDKTITFRQSVNSPIFANEFLYQSGSIKYPPTIDFNNTPVRRINSFMAASGIREITSNTFKNLTFHTDTQLKNIFDSCKYLKSIPNNLFSQIYQVNSTKSASDSIAYWLFAYCYALREIYGAPYETYVNTQTSNMFVNTFKKCHSLKHLTFYRPSSQGGVLNAVNQVINLSEVGYFNFGNEFSPITYSEDSSAFYVGTDPDPDYVTNLASSHYYGVYAANSTYNRKSAVETINSLPDTTEALANNTGTTNTIQFKANAGSAGGDDYNISKLSEAEIAVAANRGWTVAFVE